MYRFNEATVFSCGLLGLIWAVFLVVEHGWGLYLGVVPRTGLGLIGIPFSAFFHADLHHIVANSVPLFVLAFLFALECRSSGRAALLTLGLASLGGAIVWLVGSAGVHLGASLLIFAFFGFLVCGLWHPKGRGGWSGLFRIALAVVALGLYGTLFFAFFRFDPGVSWAAHAGGALAGCVVRRYTV